MGPNAQLLFTNLRPRPASLFFPLGGENDIVGLVLRSLEFMDLAGKTGLPFYTVV